MNRVFAGAPPGTQTPNPRIKSPLLRNFTRAFYQYIYAKRCQDNRNQPRESTACERQIPRSTATSEQTWSKHGNLEV
jgi:hypothetical protein